MDVKIPNVVALLDDGEVLLFVTLEQIGLVINNLN